MRHYAFPLNSGSSVYDKVRHRDYVTAHTKLICYQPRVQQLTNFERSRRFADSIWCFGCLYHFLSKWISETFENSYACSNEGPSLY